MKPENLNVLKKYTGISARIIAGMALTFGAYKVSHDNRIAETGGDNTLYSQTVEPILPNFSLYPNNGVDKEGQEKLEDFENSTVPNMLDKVQGQQNLVEQTLEPNVPYVLNQNAEINSPIASAGVGNPLMSALVTGYYCEYDSGFKGDGGGYCDIMRNGEKPYEGAAACGSNWPLGTEIYIENLDRTVVCKDTGKLLPNQIDVFSYYSSRLVSSGSSPVVVRR